MSDVKEVKSGLVAEKVVVKTPVIKDVPVIVEEPKVASATPGHSSRAFRA